MDLFGIDFENATPTPTFTHRVASSQGQHLTGLEVMVEDGVKGKSKRLNKKMASFFVKGGGGGATVATPTQKNICPHFDGPLH